MKRIINSYKSKGYSVEEPKALDGQKFDALLFDGRETVVVKAGEHKGKWMTEDYELVKVWMWQTS